MSGAKIRDLPAFLKSFVRSTDRCFRLGADPHGAVLVSSDRLPRIDLLHARLGLATGPKESSKSGNWFVRASLASESTVKAVVIEGDAVAQYFYGAKSAREATLYSTLGVGPEASVAGIRFAWRLRNAEARLARDQSLRRTCERAFNILANHDLRACYDAYLAQEAATLPFPYGGSGEILVAGNLSRDGTTFFAREVLAYKPETVRKKLKVRLRRFEFLPDRLVLLDPRRKTEVWLDSGLLSGFQWETSWNSWKHWLRSAIDVEATFVSSAKYRLVGREWVVRSWWTALPSRISLTVPDDLEAGVERARCIHELLGRYSELVQRVREQAQRQPIEASVVQSWLDRLEAPAILRPEYLCWRPDYDEYHFAQLRKRALTWFVFRDEFLFVLRAAIISEIPMPGHATYLFALPADREAFLRRYQDTSRNEIRQNAGNVTAQLGFAGRVVHGTKRKRWLADVLRLAGEKATYVDSVEN